MNTCYCSGQPHPFDRWTCLDTYPTPDHNTAIERERGRRRTIERQVDPIVVGLQEERQRQGLSQTALARRMGLDTYGTISEHERGVNQPGLPLLRRWTAALGCDIALTHAGGESA